MFHFASGPSDEKQQIAKKELVAGFGTFLECEGAKIEHKQITIIR